MNLKYKRVLLKLSGESLSGKIGHGIDFDTVVKICEPIKKIVDMGCEVAIVVSKEYQNRHIGRQCIADMLCLAREKGMQSVKANIYSFNTQSQAMFLSLGFKKISDEWYEYNL